MDNERIPTMPQGMESERIPTMPQGMESERIPTMPQGMESERIPTMPQGMESERIPTMPQGMEGERVPTMPQGMEGERVPTMPQGMEGERVPTMPQGMQGADGRVPTMPQQAAQNMGAVTGQNLLMQDVFFRGQKGGSYEIISCLKISANSGESQIYACNCKESEEKFVARILTSLTPASEPEKLRTREKVIRFLDSVKNHPHILPLVDYATVNIGGRDHFVEVYPYCENGDLSTRQGKISFLEITRDIVPAVNEALKAFHSAGFVHRDIKPDNLYKYKGKVVIGDFGITCDLREDGFATDKYKTGTLGYYAPELMSQAAIAASDYYSFGQTVWTLYSGEMMYMNLLRMYKEQGVAEQRNQINFAMLSSQYYGLEEISKEDAFLEVLIRGLLQYDPKERFNYDKVKRWLAGDRSLAHEIVSYKDNRTFTRGLKIGELVCWDNADVCKALCKDWDTAKYYLYNSALKDFYASQDFETARFMDGIMKRFATHENEGIVDYVNDLGLAKVMLYLSDYKVLYWRGEQFKTLEDVSRFAEKALQTTSGNKYFLRQATIDLVIGELVAEWHNAGRKPQKTVLDMLREMREFIAMGELGEETMLAWLSTCFRKDQSTVEIYGCYSMSQLIAHMTQSAAYMYVVGGNGNKFWVDNPVFLGFLCNKGYSGVVKMILQSTQKALWARYQELYTYLEAIVEGESRELLRKKIYQYGPLSHLLWWKNHLDVYEFVGNEPQSLKQKIEEVVVNETMSLQEQGKAITKLQEIFADFRKYDVSDIFLAQMGLLVGKRNGSIRAKSIEGVWNYRFLGNAAPLGYKYHCGL